MVRYQTRPGVLLCEVCGEYLLVAARAALNECPYVTQLNDSSAFIWRKMVSGATFEDLEKAVQEEYEIDNIDQAASAIRDFVYQMSDLSSIAHRASPQSFRRGFRCIW